ncbi:MAG: hypothetical protein LBT09_02185 [Planctomycetaceae bacterium]|nr:hypothetical protein [Planctomycetaceae bacterium]
MSLATEVVLLGKLGKNEVDKNKLKINLQIPLIYYPYSYLNFDQPTRPFGKRIAYLSQLRCDWGKS